MSSKHSSDWFSETEFVISEPFKFKVKLAIGEDAYLALRVKNTVLEAWDTLGVATTAVTVAKSSAVASTFFAPSGFLAAIGMGTAVTPVGWLVAAGVVSSGAWVGITRYLKKQTNSRVIVIPKFINTPLDVLAIGLFDLMSPLALKVSMVDGKIAELDKVFISHYFIKEWGYDPTFVKEGMALTEMSLPSLSIKEMAYCLAEFQKNNPDCNFNEMSQEILKFLKGIIESNGKFDEREGLEIAKIEAIFNDVGKTKIGKTVETGFQKVINRIERIIKKGS